MTPPIQKDVEAWLDHLFKYHSPKDDQPARYAAIREAGKFFAKVVMEHTPAGGDQQAAIRKIREAVMTANAAIALEQLG